MIHGLALCAGAGGLELGLHLALGDAYRTVGYVERDAYAAATLVARMEDEALDLAPVWDDLSTFDGHPWRGRVDLVSAGFPCQPASTAGRRRGTDDERWLWPEVVRVVRAVGPRLLFVENVPGLLTVNGGAAFEEVVEDLAALGFSAEWDRFSASEVGAPHRRERVFLLAYTERSQRRTVAERRGGADGPGDERREAPGSSGVVGPLLADAGRQCRERRRDPRELAAPARDQQGQGLQRQWPGDAPCDGCGDVANPCGNSGRPQPRRRSREVARLQEHERSPLESDRRSGWLAPFPPGPGAGEKWAAILASRPDLAPALESGVRGMAHELANGVGGREPSTRVDQLRVLGNGVVPLVAAVAFIALARRAKCYPMR